MTAPARTGLIGTGIQASRSPAMHMTEARAQGLDLIYDLLDLERMPGGVDGFSEVFSRVRDSGYLGVNTTHPVKQAVLPLLDAMSDDVRLLGACNTVVFRDGKSMGHNTDWVGFADSVRHGLPGIALDKVLQLGAGGAGTAVTYGLVKLGVKHIAIHDLDRAKAQAVADRLGALGSAITLVDNLEADAADASGVVNCTPIGMAIHPGMPLPAGLLRSSHWVTDIVYFPIWTELLRTAAQLGCRTLDGGGMSLYQGIQGFELFTGLTPNVERMAQHYRDMAAAERLAG